MSSLFSLDNPTFASFVFYGSLALAKTTAMALVTARQRFKNGSFASSEDVRAQAPKNPEKQKQLLRPNEDVERVRRAHLNDLENVVPFVMMGLLYVSTNPNPTTALWHFRIFLTTRVLHSIVYVNEIRQPARALTFFCGMGVFVSMAYQTIMATCKHY